MGFEYKKVPENSEETIPSPDVLDKLINESEEPHYYHAGTQEYHFIFPKSWPDWVKQEYMVEFKAEKVSEQAALLQKNGNVASAIEAIMDKVKVDASLTGVWSGEIDDNLYLEKLHLEKLANGEKTRRPLLLQGYDKDFRIKLEKIRTRMNGSQNSGESKEQTAAKQE